MQPIAYLLLMLLSLMIGGCQPIVAPMQVESAPEPPMRLQAAPVHAPASTATLLPTVHRIAGARLDAGEHVFDIAIADLNNDGLPDLAVPDNFDNFLRVFLNEGGVFGEGVAYATGVMPNSVAAEDFDGDGDLDLAVANETSGTVTVLRNDGKGGFAEMVDYAAAPNPWSVIAFDANGDGHADLAMPLEWHWIGLLLNKGDGTFEELILLDGGKWSGSGSIQAADVTGDGAPDLIARCPVYPARKPDVVKVLVNTGDGTFGPAIDYRIEQTPHGIEASDLNGDGFVDLIIPTGERLDPGLIEVLYNDGSGHFAQGQSFAAGKTPLGIHVIDLDRDGDADMLVPEAGSNSIGVLINDGSGTYGHTDDFFLGVSPVNIALHDIDGNGKDELIATSFSGDIIVFSLPASFVDEQ